MCFSGEADWTAEIFHEEVAPNDCPRRCDDCRRDIAVGETCRRMYWREYEECRNCSDDAPCADDEHSFGQEEEMWHCTECVRFFEAIRAAEEAEGCHGAEATPMIGMLLDELSEVGIDNRRRYVAKAREMFPDLPEAYLARMLMED